MMTKPDGLEQCPDCGAWLPPASEGAIHRYIGASPACWAIFSALVNAGEPPLAPHPLIALLPDAYAAQHPGVPSAQAVQSVAVHLLTLYGVLECNVAPEQTLWIRQRAVRGAAIERHVRFVWLTPPDFAGSPTVADITAKELPAARTEQAIHYIEAVWNLWAQRHQPTIAAWYQRYVIDTP
ncbi:MAG: hypothetical protein BroJett021_49980 [Chloroflexota bacterium]|jgi:hypothetical protein|nr:hypothetical protein [Caldilinea sp.]GIK76010.1 MAG: hypothetical protein BroJett021_49980 [Chloroflexota bacterium]